MRLHGFLTKPESMLFVLLLISYSYFFRLEPLSNINSRMNLVRAVVEEGTFRIDKYHTNTIDKAYYKGHYYSEKAIGPSFLAIPVYWILWNLSKILGFPLDFSLARYLLTVGVVSIPASLLGVLIFKFTAWFSSELPMRRVVTLGYALGTMAFPYSTLFYDHQPSTFFFFFSFYLLFKLRSCEVKKSHLFLSGFLAGYGVISQYLMALLIGPLMLYGFYRLKRIQLDTLSQTLIKILCFFLGIIPPAVLLLIYNYLCFGEPFVSSYKYVWLPAFQEGGSKGILGVSIPDTRALYFITFSAYRGLFYFSPFLWLSIAGFYNFWKRHEFRAEFYLFLSLILILFLFNSAFYGWWGGWTYGPRYIIPIIPFLTIPIVLIPSTGRRILVVLVGLSMIIQFIGSSLNPQLPDNLLNPILDWAVPQFLFGDLDLNWGELLGLPGLASLFPLGIVMVLAFYQLFKESFRNLFRDYDLQIHLGVLSLIFLSPFILNSLYLGTPTLFHLGVLGISLSFISKLKTADPSNQILIFYAPAGLLGGFMVLVIVIYSATWAEILHQAGFLFACLTLFVIVVNTFQNSEQIKELGLALFLTLSILVISEFQGFLGEPVQNLKLFTFFEPIFTNQAIYRSAFFVFLAFVLGLSSLISHRIFRQILVGICLSALVVTGGGALHGRSVSEVQTLLTELGILGASIVMGVVGFIGWDIFSRIKQAKNINPGVKGLAFSYLALLAYSLVDRTFRFPFWIFFATVVTGLLVASLRPSRLLYRLSSHPFKSVKRAWIFALYLALFLFILRSGIAAYFHQLGLLEMRTENYLKAIRYLEFATKLEPLSPAYHYQLAKAYLRASVPTNKTFEEAVSSQQRTFYLTRALEEYTKAVKRAPRESIYRKELSDLYRSLGSGEEVQE